MATVVCNIAKGRVVEYYNRVREDDPTGCSLVIAPMTGTATDSNLEDNPDYGTARRDYTFFVARQSSGLAELYVELFAADLAVLPSPNHTSDRFDLVLPSVAMPITTNIQDTISRVAVYYAYAWHGHGWCESATGAATARPLGAGCGRKRLP